MPIIASKFQTVNKSNLSQPYASRNVAVLLLDDPDSTTSCQYIEVGGKNDAVEQFDDVSSMSDGEAADVAASTLSSSSSNIGDVSKPFNVMLTSALPLWPLQFKEAKNP